MLQPSLRCEKHALPNAKTLIHRRQPLPMGLGAALRSQNVAELQLRLGVIRRNASEFHLGVVLPGWFAPLRHNYCQLLAETPRMLLGAFEDCHHRFGRKETLKTKNLMHEAFRVRQPPHHCPIVGSSDKH
jgi:hypothetical protein